MNELLKKKMQMHQGGGGGRLPSAYQEVEYIQTQGNQYLVTGAMIDDANVIEMKFYAPTGNQGCLCGGYDVITSTNIWYSESIRINNGNIIYAYESTCFHAKIFTMDIEHEIVLGNEYAYLDGELMSYHNDTNSIGAPISLFSGRWSEGMAHSTSGSRIYSFKVTNNDTVILNLIPCYRISDNVVGMYDTISETFLTKLLTSGPDFIAGPPVNS